MTKIEKILANQGENYIFPFFWQHGEDETTLRHYMKIIAEANIGAVCVESRPHPDYCGSGWWKDLDIILDEARNRNMKVWILDDSHFPTGYANGALENESADLRRQFITYQILGTYEAGDVASLQGESYAFAQPFEMSRIEQYILPHLLKNGLTTFDDDLLLGLIAVKVDGSGMVDIIQITNEVVDLKWTAPDGTWKVYALHLTKNRGPHREYINMLDKKSCSKLIEAVYEPHYKRYKADFGKTIAGFFSDEPELGNGHLYELEKNLSEMEDIPFSKETEYALKERWGDAWILHLPLIWEEKFDAKLKAKIRYDYMDVVTRLVEKNFSYQLGDWCRKHGVQYIGHLIEDNNQHAKTGSSLGHFFRGLAGQDMAGIDNIGGQVLPFGEDIKITSPLGTPRDGQFYHYVLGKLGASASAIEPLKKGRAMCENFGNYGWESGVYQMKYLADHFMVRGINHFVPHAFTPKAFPDPDCPPHFYAHGHNPQYRHFGALMAYMNRICNLINDGRHIAPVAILYHGEADWIGQTCMFMQEPARILADRQIDYNFIPTDVFACEKYKTQLSNPLKVNTQEYQVLIVPEMAFITTAFAKAIHQLKAKGFPIVFINQLPTGICDGDDALLAHIEGCQVLTLDELIPYLDNLNVAEIKLTPANARMRYLHYIGAHELYYFFNEDATTFQGEVSVPTTGKCYAYNAWENKLEKVEAKENDNGTTLCVTLEPLKSFIVIFDETEIELSDPVCVMGDATPLNDGWKRSSCTSLNYPNFEKYKTISLPDHLELENPDFAGFIRYEKEIDLKQSGRTTLEITDAGEAVEVFVNGISAGVQIVPSFVYDISDLVHDGNNQIVIEVATTLERAIEKRPSNPLIPNPPCENHCGLTGKVMLWQE